MRVLAKEGLGNGVLSQQSKTCVFTDLRRPHDGARRATRKDLYLPADDTPTILVTVVTVMPEFCQS
jgi:hypothetical protein